MVMTGRLSIASGISRLGVPDDSSLNAAAADAMCVPSMPAAAGSSAVVPEPGSSTR
jgi:hypothetical protein